MPLDDVRAGGAITSCSPTCCALRLQEPGRAAALHEQPLRWHAQHGLADDAVRHALAAGDGSWAAKIIEEHFDAVYLTGASATLQRWLSAVPAELVRSRPRLGLAQTFMALVGSDLEQAGALLDNNGSWSGGADEAFDPSVGKPASLLANVPAALASAHAWLAYLRGDAETMAAFASQAHTVLDDREWMLQSIYQLNLALADWLRGRLGDADHGFVSCVAGWRSAGERALAAGGCNFLGQVQLAQGRLDAALGTYFQLLQIGTPHGMAALPVAGIGYVGTAGVEYQRDEHEAALRHVTDSITCHAAYPRNPNPWPPACDAGVDPVGQRGIKRVHWKRWKGRAGRAEPGGVRPYSTRSPAHRAWLLLAKATSRPLPAGRKRRASAGWRASVRHRREYLVLARSAGELPGRALALLERTSAAAQSQDRTGSLIEIQALQALAHAQEGDEARAVDALVGALRLGCSQGYVRVFADEGAPMGALLGLVLAAQREEHATARLVPLSYLVRILRAFDRAERKPTKLWRVLAGQGPACRSR